MFGSFGNDCVRAHQHSAGHRDEIMASEVCGCFHCVAIFRPADIGDWIEENPYGKPNARLSGYTALCPECGIDAVIGSASGYPITPEFLQEMRRYWFC